MTYNKTEKEIIKAIVKYKDKAGSLAEMFNKSHLLEKLGFAIAKKDDGSYYLFFLRNKYDISDSRKVKGYLAGLISLIELLYQNRLLVGFPSSTSLPLVIGKENVTRHHFDINKVDNGKEFIVLENTCIDWVDRNKQSLYWWEECTGMIKPVEQYLFSDFQPNQDLVDLVKNNFKSEEQIRFEKQQRLTWISILIAFVTSLASIIISIVK